MLAYITGLVDQELLLRTEYLAAENRILRTQIEGRLRLSGAERATLGEIGHRLGRLVGFAPGSFIIADMAHFQAAPAEVERRIKQTAEFDGPGVDVWIEEEPGSAGISLVDHCKRNVLAGHSVHGDRPTGDKLSYASPLASFMDSGYVSMVVDDSWNDVVITELELFMQGRTHDDTVDACSKGYRILTLGPHPLGGVPAPDPLSRSS
jgi:predicted phage terminase large subunit-like protein